MPRFRDGACPSWGWGVGISAAANYCRSLRIDAAPMLVGADFPPPTDTWHRRPTPGIRVQTDASVTIRPLIRAQTDASVTIRPLIRVQTDASVTIRPLIFLPIALRPPR